MTLHKAQAQVEAFHRSMGLPIGTSPAIRNAHLRGSLIEEEAAEILAALDMDDFVGAIDGLCDLIYVCLGAAVEWGIDLDPFWMEVQMSNMAKVGGPIRADGKQLKPEGWKPPRIADILKSQIVGAFLDADSLDEAIDVAVESYDRGDLFAPVLGGEA